MDIEKDGDICFWDEIRIVIYIMLNYFYGNKASLYIIF